MLALARLYLTVDDLDACQQQCVQLLKMDAENDAATVVSKSAVYKKTKYSKWFEPGGNMLRHVATCCDMLRPIVSFCGSPTYQLSMYLTTILQPLTDKSRRKLQSTEDFINATKTVQIPDDYKLVSFDVKSLFTSIPLQLALQCTETAILQSTDPLPLPTEDIMDLLNLCLTSTYFQYNGKHYSYTVQLWGFQFLLL